MVSETLTLRLLIPSRHMRVGKILSLEECHAYQSESQWSILGRHIFYVTNPKVALTLVKREWYISLCNSLLTNVSATLGLGGYCIIARIMLSFLVKLR